MNRTAHVSKTRLAVVALMYCVLFRGALAGETNTAAIPGRPSAPQYIIRNPREHSRYSPESRRWTGVPQLAVTPEGRLWVTFFASTTGGEDANNYVVLTTSSDKGRTWEEVLVVDPDGDGPLRGSEPTIWIAPDKTFWLFWAHRPSPGQTDRDSRATVWTMKTGDLETNHPNWSAPQYICDGFGSQKPIALSSGEWLYPSAASALDPTHSAQVYLSTDRGSHWSLSGAAPNEAGAENYGVEHSIVERKDGSVWMLARTRKDGICESVSTDKGRTWLPLKPLTIKHTASRFFLDRLSSGNLLLIKHGPIALDTGRSHLMAFLSKDDGRTWSKGLLIDQRVCACYPAGQQATDGTIYVTYDTDRLATQEITMVAFTEEDILSPDYDESIIKVARSRKIITKGGPR